MADSNPIVIQENWETYSYTGEDHPVFVTFYAGAGEIRREDYPFCARVIFPIKQPNRNGGPIEAEAELLWRLEDSLTEALAQHGAKCLQLARMTHDGKRELVFQVADWDQFRPPVGRWLRQIPDYDIDVSEHDGWGFFEDCIWPRDEDWRMIYNRRVVDNLLDAGSNPENEHSLEFVFRGEPSRLQKLRDELRQRGYEEIESTTPLDPLVMAKKLVLDLERICQEDSKNEELSVEFGVELDGWGAAVVK